MTICDEIDDESFGKKAANLIEFVQNCTLPRDTTKIKRMFEETIGVRQTMMLNLDTFKPLFDLLLQSPDLVISVVLSENRADYLLISFNDITCKDYV